MTKPTLPIPWLDQDDETTPLPDPQWALSEPNGLLAIGGSLSPQRLEAAYRAGIFPWFSAGEPILWWSPDPRALIYPDRFHTSRSLARALRRDQFTVTLDQAFNEVLSACAAPRAEEQGTWITPEMQSAYWRLHQQGIAHSIEVWRTGELVGGVYGVSLGHAFFGESMFSRVSNASKIALAWLCAQLRAWQFDFLDCQMPTNHLLSLGAVCLPRAQFLLALAASQRFATRQGPWELSVSVGDL